MSALWLRLYTDILNDPKVQKMPGELFKQWINILCIAKENDGLVKDVQIVSFCLRLVENDAENLLKELVKRGLLERSKKGYFPHNWNGRQFVSDRSNERVKRYRNAQCNARVTPPETETETETEELPLRKITKSVPSTHSRRVKNALCISPIAVILEEVVDRVHAEALIAHRKSAKHPLDPYKAQLLAQRLAACPDPNAAADEMIARGWRSIKPTWLEEGKQGNGQARSSPYIEASKKLFQQAKEKDDAATRNSAAPPKRIAQRDSEDF